MSELQDSKDAIDRKKIENRKLLDAAELVTFGLPLPEKAKLLCLYFLRTCDWLTLTRGEGRAVLSRILGCSEDQVSRYTRPLDQCGVIQIIGRGSNQTGLVHTYRIQLNHRFWAGDPDEVAAVANAISRRIKKGPSCSGTTSQSSNQEPPSNCSAEAPAEYAASGIGRERHAARGISDSRPRRPDMPPAAVEHAASAALPLLPPSSPSPPIGREGGRELFEPEVLPHFPIPTTQVTDKELEGIVRTHGLVKPDLLMDKYRHSSRWTEQLRFQVRLRFAGHYVFQVTDGRNEYCSEYCPDDANIIAITLRNLVNASPSSPLSLQIKHLYPDMWPSASSGNLTIDEEKAALDWLKDTDRSGTHSDFLNGKRDRVMEGRPLSPKQLEAVINNWRNSASCR